MIILFSWLECTKALLKSSLHGFIYNVLSTSNFHFDSIRQA